MKSRAFTKKWALFCAGKEFTKEDMLYRSGVIRNENFRKRKYRRASVRFCSALDTNLSESVIREGGDFTGNGWERCVFSGADYADLTMEQEIYASCIFGNARFCGIQMMESQVRACNFTGSSFIDAKISDCIFDRCVFRKTRFVRAQIMKTVFRGCIFDRPQMEGIAVTDTVFQSCFFEGWDPNQAPSADGGADG